MTPTGLGRWAEAAAAKLYAARGGRIAARNLRTPYGEIDLLIEEDGVLVVVEVKARARGALAAVTARQRRRLVSAAAYLLSLRGDAGISVRFDVVAIDLRNGAPVIHHIEGAWDASDPRLA